jgi:hypothetical protein
MTISVTNFYVKSPSIWHSHIWIARMALDILKHIASVQGGNKNFHMENSDVWDM